MRRTNAMADARWLLNLKLESGFIHDGEGVIGTRTQPVISASMGTSSERSTGHRNA